jgi:hypothetical protein
VIHAATNTEYEMVDGALQPCGAFTLACRVHTQCERPATLPSSPHDFVQLLCVATTSSESQ